MSCGDIAYLKTADRNPIQTIAAMTILQQIESHFLKFAIAISSTVSFLISFHAQPKNRKTRKQILQRNSEWKQSNFSNRFWPNTNNTPRCKSPIRCVPRAALLMSPFSYKFLPLCDIFLTSLCCKYITHLRECQ